MNEIIFVIKAVILGIVEGLSEFLPISSTGHLIIFRDLLGMPSDEFTNMFLVVIQLGAILAVVLLFWKKIVAYLQMLFKGKKEGKRFFLNVIIACIPAGIIGFLLGDFIEEKLFSVLTVALALIVGAIFMLFMEKWLFQKLRKDEISEISLKDSALVGAFQSISVIWPGFSRSAATIMGGWYCGMKSSLAAEFSFFLAIPLLAAASGLSLIKTDFSSFAAYQYVSLILGFLTAFVSALIVVKAFINYLRKKSMAVFAYYRLAVGCLMLVLIVLKII